MRDHEPRPSDDPMVDDRMNPGDLRRFESRFRDGDRPSIEGSIADSAASRRPGLLSGLIEAEVRLRREEGERPSPSEYLERFPDHAAAIVAAFEGHSITSSRAGDGDRPHSGTRSADDFTMSDGESLASGREGGTERAVGERSGTKGVGSPKEGCRYRILSHHKTGGLGEIFLAEDTELGRNVALKEIRDRYALDAQARARFQLEAEVIGNLEHPGIVPIYGVGHYRDGRPYYAMRFVKGDSLREAIDRFHEGQPKRPTGDHELMFRGLLGRFVAACNAIDYAHSRGVLHRDLKPGNIMLGRFGETFLVDWGLAKVLGLDGELDEEPEADEDETEGPFRSHASEGVEPTRAHSALGTPRYMSPEQADGKLDRIGPASDIFGLGATLYCLLTGRAPYTGSTREEIEERAQRRDFSPPRKVRREVPPPLESICLKAMAADPGQRYPSARGLADDIERWLADEPAYAHEYPAPARLARWVRRHRTLAAAASVLLVALSIGSVVVVAKEKVAAYNFKLTGEVIEEMLVRVGDERLLYVPQMNELRSALGDEAVRYNKKLLDQYPDDPDLRWNYANKCYRAANNHMLAGRLARFLEYNQEIMTIYRSLIDDDPANPRYANAFAYAELERGSALQRSGKVRPALDLFRSALNRGERLIRGDPKSEVFRYTLASARMYLCDALMAVGEYLEARGHFDSAIDQLTPVVLGRPNSHEFRRNLAQLLCGRGVVAAGTGDHEGAGRMFDRATAQVDELRDRGDAPVEVDILRVYVLRERGLWLASRPGRLPDAERDHDQAARLMERHCKDYPDVRDYQVERATALLNRGLARAGLDAEKKRDAEADLEQALKLLEASTGPDRTPVLGEQGRAKGALGRLSILRGEREPGILRLKEAVALQRECLRANEASPIDRKALRDHEEALRAAGVAPPY